jgi:hypothetical protein
MTSPLSTLFDEPWHGTTKGYRYKKCRCADCKSAKAAERKKSKSRPITGDEQWHGTVSGYVQRGCRCEKCSLVHKQYRQEILQDKRGIEIQGDEPWHGTLSGYTEFFCRCEHCSKIGKEKMKQWRKNAIERPITGLENWHGSYHGYTTNGCRCDMCFKAQSDYRKRIRNLPIIGDESWHGTEYGYARRGCRCPKCHLERRACEAARKYGISKNKAQEMLSDPVCAICETQKLLITEFYFDHDHSCCPNQKACGACVRGLLCRHCNAVIGFANDDPEILKAAIAYLERYSA